MIEVVWELTQEWEGHWADWKNISFQDLQAADMESHSLALYKKLNKYSRELKVLLLPGCAFQKMIMKRKEKIIKDDMPQIF